MTGGKSRKRSEKGGEGRITMADLARLAGVSAITVSRALKDSPLVNEQTRAHIQALAREHGYALNVSARNLRLRRSYTIAVIVEMTPSPERPMSGSYPLELLGGIAQELTGAGYSLLLSARHDSITAAEQSAEGVILLGQGAHGEAVEVVDRWNLPLVVWGAASESGNRVVVGSDNRAGGSAVAGHFLSLGRKRPCFMGNPNYAENAERLAGYSDALARDGGIEPELIADVDFTAAAGTEAMRRRLAADGRLPDALFAANDLLAIGAIQALREHGLRIPDDISVAGYDDTALGASMSPALTSVHQDLYQAGILLARKMLDLIEQRSARSETLPTRLVVRET